MENPRLTLQEFQKTLQFVCAVDTAAAGGEGWTQENPTWGHCAVASLVAQNFFGGELLRISLDGTDFAASRSHYFNRLPDGTLFDATEAQFQGRLTTTTLPAEKRTREYVLEGADTRERYAILAFRFARALHSGNPLFDEPLYRECLLRAYASPCQKAGFGVVIVHRGQMIASDHNRTIEALRDMCESSCMRLQIASRTESMLGACGHAEEWAMKAASESGIALSECEIFIAGLRSNGEPWIKDKATHSCLRCAVAMYYANLRQIWVPVWNRWEALTPEQCLASAKAYALGETKA